MRISVALEEARGLRIIWTKRPIGGLLHVSSMRNTGIELKKRNHHSVLPFATKLFELRCSQTRLSFNT